MEWLLQLLPGRPDGDPLGLWPLLVFLYHFGVTLTIHLPLLVILVGILLVQSTNAGKRFGIPQLFFHERPLTQGVNGFFVCLLTGMLVLQVVTLTFDQIRAIRDWYWYAEGAMFVACYAVTLVALVCLGSLVQWLIHSRERLLDIIVRVALAAGVAGVVVVLSFGDIERELDSGTDQVWMAWTVYFGWLMLLALALLVPARHTARLIWSRRWFVLGYGGGVVFSMAMAYLTNRFVAGQWRTRADWLLTVKSVCDQIPVLANRISSKDVMFPLFFAELLVWSTLALLLAVILRVNAVMRRRDMMVVSPAAATCVALAVVAGIYGFVFFWLGVGALALYITFPIVMMIAGARRFRLRYRDLDDHYRPDRIVDLATVETRSRHTMLLRRPSLPDPVVPGRPLVVVTTSGGGLTAAAWTVAILHRLQNTPGLEDFARSVRLITGASGGMVGASYWSMSLTEDGTSRALPTSETTRRAVDQTGRHPLFENIARDCLSDVAYRFALVDPMTWFGAPFARLKTDRGEALQRAWENNLDGSLETTFGQLCGERWRPELVFSPVMVEDGRRLLISNLDLDFLTRAGSRRARSTQAVEFRKLFPAAMRNLRLSTAARMSATFPFLSPASYIPTRPARRIVDAGYYDNYGVNLAARWLDALAESIQVRYPGVLLLQLSNWSDLNALTRPPEARGTQGAFWRGFGDLLGPVAGIFNAWYAMAAFRNDEQVERLEQRFDPAFFVTERMQCARETPVSWYLTERDKQRIWEHAMSPVIGHAVDRIRTWWQDRVKVGEEQQAALSP